MLQPAVPTLPAVDAYSTYESMDREERLRRIGALFSKAVTLIGNRDPDVTTAMGADMAKSASTEQWPEFLEPLVRRFQSLGTFSPKEAADLWVISRTSCYRRLRQLETEGWIIRNGKTRAVRYHFCPVLKTLTKAGGAALREQQ